MNTNPIPDMAWAWIQVRRAEWESASTPAEAQMVIERLAGDYFATYHRELTFDLELLERQEAHDKANQAA